MCEIPFDYKHAIRNRDPLNEEQRSYELPDGKEIIQVDHKTRFTATEILFNPEIIDQKQDGVAKMAFDSIERCDTELKNLLYTNTVLCGGSTMLPGFQERFEHEIKNLAMDATKADIDVSIDLHRKFSSWVGGSMIASMSTFRDISISRSDFLDTGDQRGDIVLKKTIF